jgi:hypothetical protein
LRDKVIGHVKPHLFEDILILGLSYTWVGMFEKVPSFIIKVNKKGKLVLESTEQVNGL